ncbi:MAG TPA: AAA family ATPase, partial [Solirubrobacteraceae bacterium]|nr:AAA family ATPase [Solirubrobacteraceae bacterium]
MPDAPKPRPPHRRRGFLWFVGLLLALNFGSVLLVRPASQTRVNVPFSPYFVTAVRDGRVASIASKGDTIQGTFKVAVRFPAGSATAPSTRLFSTEVPTFWNDNQLTAMLQAHNVQINATSPTAGGSLVASLLFGFGPTLLIVGLFVVFARRASRGGAAGALGNFGRSQARRIDPATIRITFADVAGIDEAKTDLTEIVDFLRDPKRYGRLGGRMPHGVLLSGAPGTGKTLLARAVAGEAHAAFFSISASEFIEAIVGVGASRVRDLFTKA